MLTTHARLPLLCALSFASIGCGDDPAVERGNTQPGEACRSTDDCAIGFACQDLLCEQIDPVRITLSWTADTDFDLHVATPTGELYFGQTNDQAYLGSDDCADRKLPGDGGTVVRPSCRESSEHHEHAFLRDVAMPTGLDAGDTDAGFDDLVFGEFEYWADNYGCDTAGDFTLSVVIRNGAVYAQHVGRLEAACVQSDRFPFPKKD